MVPKPPKPHDPRQTRRHIQEALVSFPGLAERIDRALLIALHTRGSTTIDEIHAEARALVRGDAAVNASEGAIEDNAQLARPWDELERRYIRELTYQHAAQAFSPQEVDDLVTLTRKREEAKTLEEIANLSSVSFRLLSERVKAFVALPLGAQPFPESEAIGVRVALVRHFISDQLEFIGIAREQLRVTDFGDLVDRIIGTDDGHGRIGGKAAGLFLADRILRRAQERDPAAPRIPFATPESYYLRSDVLDTFLSHLGLVELQSHKYKEIEAIRQEYPLIVKVFKNAAFPPLIVQKLRTLLERTGEHPLIVRSSSLLEDRFGAAFAGKYRSIFVANQGPLSQRLEDLLGAIAEVYASALHPDPISYRKKHNLLDYPEEMGVLIQKVVGRQHGRYFLPVWAGVAFSRNEFRRNPRVKAEDGVARLVFGLGTRAVDRVASDFARMIPLGMPTLRPEVTTQDIVRYSQHEVDVINLEENRFETVPFVDVVGGDLMPGIEQVVSVLDNGHLRRPMGTFFDAEPDEMVVTFDKFVHENRHPNNLRWMLRTLEQAYGQPVDIEFACDGEHFYLLQCRPQVTRRSAGPVYVPDNVETGRQIFSAGKDVTSGSISGIEYIVYIDPVDYDPLPTVEARQDVARAVGLLNARLEGRPFVLMGPGRWGSRDPRMGVRAGYADINNTRMLIEIARASGGFVPEASFGSHFFQDLVESDIHYLALYPDDPQNVFNEPFLRGGHDDFARLVPEFPALAGVVRVVRVPAASGGLFLRIDMDGESQRALGYLAAR